MQDIYIWGTGKCAKELLGRISLQQVAAFLDNDRSKMEFMGKKVIAPEQLVNMKYNCIIVGNTFSEEIYAQCKKIGLDLSKIIFLYNKPVLEDINRNYALAERVLGKTEAQALQQQSKDYVENHYVIPCSHTFPGTEQYKRHFYDHKYYKEDYTRIKILEMVAEEIRRRNVLGEMAELGVFQGDFAQYINYLFPHRKLYLFDSFEGFEKKEAKKEREKGFCDDRFLHWFDETSSDLVIKRMVYPENIIIKKGYFPQSLEGLEEKFAFVSLDVDLEESILEGLRYFYPRLSSGGYMFIHDYNYCDTLNLEGVCMAIERYEAEIGIYLHRVPICDQGGTLVISK